MQFKTLIILAVIAIISVGFAFLLISKGYVRIGKPDEETAEVQTDEEVEEPDEELLAEMKKIEEEIKEEEGHFQVSNLVTIPLDPIIVNVKGSFGRRYLKVTINLGIEEKETEVEVEEKKKEEPAEGVVAPVGAIQGLVESKLVEIRDTLISILSAKTMEDVDGWVNQDRIRDEIKENLNSDLGLSNAIKKVFFTEFVVQ